MEMTLGQKIGVGVFGLGAVLALVYIDRVSNDITMTIVCMGIACAIAMTMVIATSQVSDREKVIRRLRLHVNSYERELRRLGATTEELLELFPEDEEV
jgi:hypothetical protein